MENKTRTISLIAAALLALGCAEAEDDACALAAERAQEVASHMVAQASLAAHFVDAALAAGRSPVEIDQTLSRIASETAIDEFWVTDETGRVVYSTSPEIEFTFSSDPESGTQAAAFARLLTGEETVVAQEPVPREFDGEVFRYVGVAGVDRARIVQVGVRDAVDESCDQPRKKR